MLLVAIIVLEHLIDGSEVDPLHHRFDVLCRARLLVSLLPLHLIKLLVLALAKSSDLALKTPTELKECTDLFFDMRLHVLEHFILARPRLV